MAKRFEKMTPAHKFYRLMVRGWKEKKKGYVSGDFKSGNNYCAYGVVASELGVAPGFYEVRRALGEDSYDPEKRLPVGLHGISDSAGSKTRAIKELRKVLQPFF